MWDCIACQLETPSYLDHELPRGLQHALLIRLLEDAGCLHHFHAEQHLQGAHHVGADARIVAVIGHSHIVNHLEICVTESETICKECFVASLYVLLNALLVRKSLQRTYQWSAYTIEFGSNFWSAPLKNSGLKRVNCLIDLSILMGKLLWKSSNLDPFKLVRDW